jgi:hypothetical protein
VTRSIEVTGGLSVAAGAGTVVALDGRKALGAGVAGAVAVVVGAARLEAAGEVDGLMEVPHAQRRMLSPIAIRDRRACGSKAASGLVAAPARSLVVTCGPESRA